MTSMISWTWVAAELLRFQVMSLLASPQTQLFCVQGALWHRANLRSQQKVNFGAPPKAPLIGLKGVLIGVDGH